MHACTHMYMHMYMYGACTHIHVRAIYSSGGRRMLSFGGSLALACTLNTRVVARGARSDAPKLKIL